MPGTIAASVPGKVILMGEHAAVYGRPALVAAIGLRTRVAARRVAGAAVRLELPGVGHREETDWAAICRYAEERRVAWRRWAERADRSGFAAVAGRDPGHLVRVALGELARELGSAVRFGLELAVESELPVGGGFGSSAAVAVGVLAAVSRLAGAALDEAALDCLALEVERRQHGTPSGVDHRTVARGGVLEHRRGRGGALESRALVPANELLSGLAVFDTGAPAETTGEVVASVARRRERRPAWFEERLARMTAATRSFGGALASPAGRREELAGAMSGYEEVLETLGVVPAPVRRLIRAVEAAGGAAKISGAGALTGSGAGALLVEAAAAGACAPLAGLTRLAAPLGAGGLRLEDAS